MQDTSAENCYFRTETGDKYIGIPVQLLEAYKERFHTLHTVCEVEKGVWAVPAFDRKSGWNGPQSTYVPQSGR